MLTRRMAEPMIRRAGRKAKQMRELREENARLRAKCNRLIPCARRDPAMRGLAMSSEAAMQARAVGEHGDLAPEPSEPPVSHGERNDTKAPKSITSEGQDATDTVRDLHTVAMFLAGDAAAYEMQGRASPGAIRIMRREAARLERMSVDLVDRHVAETGEDPEPTRSILVTSAESLEAMIAPEGDGDHE